MTYDDFIKDFTIVFEDGYYWHTDDIYTWYGKTKLKLFEQITLNQSTQGRK